MNTKTASVDTRRSLVYWLTRLLPLLVVGLAAAFALRRLGNTDTWWHLAAGRWIATHGTVPHLDTLSWTVPDHPWINVQWLYDVIMYGIYKLGGPNLLVISSVMAYTATIAILLVNVRRHVGPLAAAVLCAWAVMISQERFEIRPEMVSYLLLSVMLWLYATGRVSNSKRLWAIPVVMCLWANAHSLFVLGMVIIISQMVGSLITDLSILPSGWRRPIEPAVRKQLLTTGAIGLAVTLINPFFIKGAFFPFKLMSRISGDNPVFRAIGEFRRPFENYFVNNTVLAYRWFFFFAVAVLLVAMVIAALQRSSSSAGMGKELSRADRRRLLREEQRRKGAPPSPLQDQPQEVTSAAIHLDLADIVVLAGIAYLSLLARRNMALFAIGGTPAIAACLALLAARFPHALRSTLTQVKGVFAAVLIFLVLGGYWFIASNGFYKWTDDLREFGLGQLDMRFPIRAAAFMKAQGLPGRLYNDLGNGGYLTWAEPIPGGVYMDGRLEVYDADFFGQYMREIADPNAWQGEMDRQGVQTVLQFHWWDNTRNLIQYLVRDSRWALVYFDETSVLFVRRAGNEELISRAWTAFQSEREAIERGLLEPVRSWQWPMGQVYALRVYSDLLNMLGKGNDAMRFQTYLSELSPANQ
ncbi:MAG: hypothetical protein M0R70_08430 [Nitrospirae bacterium]|nr:hypothetical protein [Nitrospirota bacterium]